MPAQTRRQAKNGQSKKPDDKYDDYWDIPESNLKSNIIKTYSKKQPFRKCWTSESKTSSKMMQKSHDVSSKSDHPVKPQTKNINQETSRKLPKDTPAGVRKAPATQSNSTKTDMMSGCSTTRSTRKRNKTRLAVQSMTACSILPGQPSDDIDVLLEDMSLCSMANVQIEEKDNIRNSTVLDGCCHLNIDFVPNEISAIEGQNVPQDTVISNYNEQTPKEEPIKTPVLSVKKVRFASKKIKATTTKKNCRPSAKRSILRKTPWRKKQSQDAEQCQKTSSPDPNKEFSMLDCEISSLLMADVRKKGSKNRSSNQMTEDTEKLIDFEPVPLECSEDFGENLRDVTPEAYDSVKDPTSSAKRRRRLSFQLEYEEIPACILLDYRATKTEKKARILFRNDAHISIKDLKFFPDDIFQTLLLRK